MYGAISYCDGEEVLPIFIDVARHLHQSTLLDAARMIGQSSGLSIDYEMGDVELRFADAVLMPWYRHSADVRQSP